jgi:uncharacterized membrane protein YbhN (UPF0104 family)
LSGSRVLLGLLFGAVVLVVLGLWADGRALMDSFRAFDLRYVAPVLGLTLLNYLIRFGKWHYYLGRLGHHPRPTDSALVFLSGLSMAATPGKLGELVKAKLLASRSGVPAADTASVVIAERLTDVLALVLISAGGVVASGRLRPSERPPPHRRGRRRHGVGLSRGPNLRTAPRHPEARGARAEARVIP